MIRIYVLHDSEWVWISGARRKRWMAQLNNVGSGSFEIGLTDPHAQALTAQARVRVQIGAEIVGWWTIEDVDEMLVGPNEDTGNSIVVSGRGHAAVLEKALLRPVGYPSSYDTQAEVAFGTTFGEGWDDAWQSQIPLPFTIGWTEALQAAYKGVSATAWTADVSTAFRSNTTMLDILYTMSSMGIDWLLAPEIAPRLVAREAPLGNNLTTSVIMLEARDILEMRRRTTLVDLANAVMAVESDTALTSYEHSASITALGRREVALNIKDKPNPSARANGLLAITRWPDETLELAFNTGIYRPFVDYGIGDTIGLRSRSINRDIRIENLMISQEYEEPPVARTDTSRTARDFLQRVAYGLRRDMLTPARIYGLQD